MNNGTEISTTEGRPDQAIDSDALRFPKPDWMPAERWASIVAATHEFIDRRVAELQAGDLESATPRPAGTCPERAWCINDNEDEHRSYHYGNTFELAGSDGSGRVGWWAWPTEDRGSEVTIEIEGARHPVAASSVPAWQMAAILAATATPEARAELVALLATVGVEVPR